MFHSYALVLGFFVFGIIFLLGISMVRKLINHKNNSRTALNSIEVTEISESGCQFYPDAKYLTIVLTALMILISTYLLFPVLLVAKDLKTDALLFTIIFITILYIGIAVIWRSGHLSWRYSDKTRRAQIGINTRKSKGTKQVELF